MKLINSFFSWLIKKRLHQIELFKKYPVEVQEEWFKKLIQQGAETEWGKKYKYKEIQKIEEYQQRVPISTYDDIKHLVERIRKGEQYILWNTEVKYFAKSSGTTSDKSKYIPVSEECLEECHYKAGKDMLAIYCNNYPDTSIFTSKGIAIGGSHTIHEVNSEDYYTGDLSAILMKNLPFWAEFLRTPDISIALMDDWEAKIQKIVERTVNQNIVHISGVPSWSLLLMEKVIEYAGKQYIDEVWENFEVYFHGGVNFNPYRHRFYSMFYDKSKPRLMEIYNASEGFIALEDEVNSGELLLMLDYGIFFEFLPLTELNSDNPKAILLQDVEVGKQYALVITTNSGLWRYLIGDTVVFTSTFPFKIKITGRTKSFINIVGEELMVENAEKAITEACQKTNAIIEEFTVGPYFDNRLNVYRHLWLIEFNKMPDDLNFFTEVLDNSLKHYNSDYEAKRYKNMVLYEPLIETLPSGTFYKWLKNKGKLGGQNKVPRLVNNTSIIEEIHKIVKEYA